MRTMERDIVTAATSAKKSRTARHQWPNITRAEQSVMMWMREFNVGYNTADKKLRTTVQWFSRKNCLRSNACYIWRIVRDLLQDNQPDEGGYTR